jgi:AbiTii
MATLLQQMQEDATNHEAPVATLLRRSLVLAKRLDYLPVGEWAQRELEGYPNEAELPSYRAYRRCQVVGEFNGIGGARMTNQPLQSHVVDEAHRKTLFGLEFRDGIPTYEAMANPGEGATLSFPWSMDVVAHYQSSFIRGWGLAHARRLVGAGDLQQLIGAVRTRLLNFTLEIEAANPDAGEASGGEAPVPFNAVDAAFGVYVMGDNNVVNAAGRDARQEISVEGPNWDGLRDELTRLGVPGDRVAELRVALGRDASLDLPPGTLGPEVSAWYRRFADTVARGVLSLPTDVVAGMIAAELLKFVGTG